VRALIATIPPARGGVPAMLRAMLALLAERGIESEVAWYEPYGMTQRLSVPSYRLGTRRPSSERREVAGASAGFALGAWLPELEFTHYWPTPLWRERIAAADLHVVVSGSCLAGLAFQRTASPFLAWVATDWHGDRRDRVREFPAARRLLDRVVVAPICRRLERTVLRSGRVLALSGPTRAELDRVAGAAVVRAVLPPPIDLEGFRPDENAVVAGRVAFVGRFDDPRKNLPLFLAALEEARRSGSPLSGFVLGGEAPPELAAEIERRGLGQAVQFHPYLSLGALSEKLRSCDLVAVTAHQEGLGIAALEAMASGCPIVSTRCGGPEEYVRDGDNGYLTTFEAHEIASRWTEIVRDRSLRSRLSASARRTIEIGYSLSRARDVLMRELDALDRSRGAGARA